MRAVRIDRPSVEVAVITLDRPAKRNALNAELRQSVIDALATLGPDGDVRAVVITGAEGTFCAGFDLGEITSSVRPAEVFAHATEYHEALHTFRKPLLAAVEGPAVAGGMDLAILCDLRVASRDAIFGQPQVAVGVPAAFELMAAVVPGSVARDLCLTGRLIDGIEAHRLGVVHRLAEPGCALEEAVAWAQQIAAVSGAATMKSMIVASQPDLFGPYATNLKD